MFSNSPDYFRQSLGNVNECVNILMCFTDPKGQTLPEPSLFREDTLFSEYVIAIIIINKDYTYYNYNLLFELSNHLKWILIFIKHSFVPTFIYNMYLTVNLWSELKGIKLPLVEITTQTIVSGQSSMLLPLGSHSVLILLYQNKV